MVVVVGRDGQGCSGSGWGGWSVCRSCVSSVFVAVWLFFSFLFFSFCGRQIESNRIESDRIRSKGWLGWELYFFKKNEISFFLSKVYFDKFWFL